jgi:hypothetical protein
MSAARMKMHFLFRHRSPEDSRLVATWCGRDLLLKHVTVIVRDVTCEQCRQAFAARLRQLPDAFTRRRER